MDLELRMMAFQFMTPLISVVVFAPVLLYVIARWRAHRDAVVDPQLGLKFLLYYFATAGLQLAMAGVTLVLYTMLRSGDGDPKGETYRLAFGFIIPASLVLGIHIALLVRTNDNQFPGVRRVFVGFNLLITGIVGFAALVLGAQALLAKGSTHGLGHFGAAAIVVYCGAWGLMLWQFDSIVLGKNRFIGGPPADLSPPQPPPPQHGAPGGGLPPLGGGAFPPIDPT